MVTRNGCVQAISTAVVVMILSDRNPHDRSWTLHWFRWRWADTASDTAPVSGKAGLGGGSAGLLRSAGHSFYKQLNRVLSRPTVLQIRRDPWVTETGGGRW